jgi:DDE superfamily endonuclease
MFITKPLPFVTSFIDELNRGIKEYNPDKSLTLTQKGWLGFCIMAIFMTNTVCWAKFECASIGRYSLAAISWMFRRSAIPWDILLIISTSVILRRYGITSGCIGIDDTDKKRSKRTKSIAYVHKIKDKGSGGYIMGQGLVFLVLITSKITIPVGFAFYMPDPELKAWKKLDEKLRKQGVPKRQRPPEPPRNKKYPTMPEIALTLLEQFKKNHPNIKIKCIFADALYGTKKFLDKASRLFGGIQVISQIRSNQNIRYRNKYMAVEEYFSKYPGTVQKIKIRGGKEVTVIVGSARLQVCAHGKKRFVIALKYEGEEEYRYIVASDLSWRTQDIVEAYTLRWFVEVFFEDWKGNEGWGKLTKHTGEDGSSRSLILSLLVDHCLFFHPEQLACVENKLPAWTVGSLIRNIKVECILYFVQEIISDENPQQKLNDLAEVLKDDVIKLEPSSKHMANRKFCRLEPIESLKYRKAA